MHLISVWPLSNFPFLFFSSWQISLRIIKAQGSSGLQFLHHRSYFQELWLYHAQNSVTLKKATSIPYCMWPWAVRQIDWCQGSSILLYCKGKERILLFWRITQFASLFGFIFFIVNGSPKIFNSSLSQLSLMFINISSFETPQFYGW